MSANLEYVVSLDVARALRDIGNLSRALEGRLVQAAGRAREAMASLDRMRVRTPVDASGPSRASLPAPSRSALPSALAFGVGAVSGRLALPGPASPMASASSALALANGGRSAASSAIVAAREIAAEARAAFAPLRLAMSRLALPSSSGGGGASRMALPGKSRSGGGIIDIEATVVSETAKSAGGLTQVFRRALTPVGSLLDGLRERARGIVAKVDVGGALRNLGSLLGRLGNVREEVRKTHEESEKGGGLISGVGGAAKSTLGPLVALAAGYLSVSVAAHQFSSAIDQAASFEQTKVGFTVLLQSGAKAKAMLADLTKFADTTPFHMPELAQAARTLLAFGDPAQNVMKDLRQLGDVAAGVQAPIGEIAELFGKARTEGTLFSIDIRELTRRGIPIIGELAKQFHVNENAIHQMAETGRIKFADLQTAIGNLTSRGGMFFGMLAAQGQTFNGMLTTMGDAWGALQREFGTPILEPLKAGVGEITAILAGWKDRAHEWGVTLANVLKGALAIVQNGDAGAALGATLKLGFAEAVNVLYKGAVATVAALITGLGEAVNVLFKGLSSGAVWKTIADGLNYAGGKFAATIMRALADAFANIPGMGRVALALNTGANQANKDANLSMDAAKTDLDHSDVRATLKAAADAAAQVGDVFKKTYQGARDPMDTDAPKSTLAGVVNRANARNNPLPISYDNEGNPYGPGAPYGSPDSQMPRPGTKPTAAGLGTGLRLLLAGASGVAPEDDPGEGTINGQPPGAVLTRRPLTLPGPLLPPTLPIPDLNARAQSLVGGGGRARDPDAQSTARNTEATTAAINRLVDLISRWQPTGATF